MRLCLFLILAFVLTACGGSRWYKQGVSDAQTRQDMAECDYDAEKATASQLYWLTALSNKITLQEKCMGVRGYRLVSNAAAPLDKSPDAPRAAEEAQCLMPGGFVRFMPPLYCERAGGKPHIGP